MADKLRDEQLARMEVESKEQSSDFSKTSKIVKAVKENRRDSDVINLLTNYEGNESYLSLILPSCHLDIFIYFYVQ